MKKTKTFLIAECGIMVALATVLSFFPLYKALYGGSVTLMSMLPIMLVSYRHGIKAGLATGFVHSVIQLIFGLDSVAYVPDAPGIVLCILLDYIIPFTAIGLAGIFRNVKFTKSSITNTIIASVLGAVLVMVFRYVCHILSGVVIWYALDLVWYKGDTTTEIGSLVNSHGPWTFSAIYNGAFMIPEIIITAIGAGSVSVPVLKFKKH